jgi:hypothetical protein
MYQERKINLGGKLEKLKKYIKEAASVEGCD